MQAKSNWLFAVIYWLEMGVKLIGLGPTGFVFSPKNGGMVGHLARLFDLFLTVACSIDLAISAEAGIHTVVIAVRMLRMLKLTYFNRHLSRLMRSIARSVISVASAFVLVAIWIFIFAAVGSQLFDRLPSERYFTQIANFENVQQASTLLFQLASGWDSSRMRFFFDPAIANAPACEGDACPPQYINAFFAVFTVGLNYMFLPLVVATLVDYFVEANDLDKALVQMSDIEHYKKAWVELMGVEQARSSSGGWCDQPVDFHLFTLAHITIPACGSIATWHAADFRNTTYDVHVS